MEMFRASQALPNQYTRAGLRRKRAGNDQTEAPETIAILASRLSRQRRDNILPTRHAIDRRHPAGSGYRSNERAHQFRIDSVNDSQPRRFDEPATVVRHFTA